MRIFYLFIFSLILVSAAAMAQPSVIVYKNEACGHCNMYLSNFRMFLNEENMTDYQEKSLINNPSIREELNKFNSDRQIPMSMQGHMVVAIEDMVLEGHVPIDMLQEFMDYYPDGNYPKVVIYQDYMLDKSKLSSYKIMYMGSIKEVPIATPIQEALDSIKEEKKLPQEAIMPLVIATAIVDSFNPCAFGVLLFFIALLFMLKRSRKEIAKIGAIYVFMIFLTYVLIGLGILQAIIISDSPHLVAQIAAVLVIILGLISIKDFFFYGRWISMKIPGSQTSRIKDWMSKATIPSAIVLGFLVGLCEFPCSGGIYVGIISMLSISATFSEGLMYLIIYNIFFVLPLVIILIAASNKRVLGKIDTAEKKYKKHMKLANGLMMIVLGLILILSTLG